MDSSTPVRTRLLAAALTLLGLAIVWYCSTRFAWLHWRTWTRDAWSMVGIAVGVAAVASLARAGLTRVLAVIALLAVGCYGLIWGLVGSAAENFEWDSTAISWFAALGYVAVIAVLLIARRGQLAGALVAISFLILTIQQAIDVIDALRVLPFAQLRSEVWLSALGFLLITLGALTGIASGRRV